jgi:hypothetical protein
LRATDGRGPGSRRSRRVGLLGGGGVDRQEERRQVGLAPGDLGGRAGRQPHRVAGGGVGLPRRVVEQVREIGGAAVVQVRGADRQAVQRRDVVAEATLGPDHRAGGVQPRLEGVDAEGADVAQHARDLVGRGAGRGLEAVEHARRRLGVDLGGVEVPAGRGGRARPQGRRREAGGHQRRRLDAPRGEVATRRGPAGAAVALHAAGVVGGGGRLARTARRRARPRPVSSLRSARGGRIVLA